MEATKTGGTGGDWEPDKSPVQIIVNMFKNMFTILTQKPIIIIIVGVSIALAIKFLKKK